MKMFKKCSKMTFINLESYYLFAQLEIYKSAVKFKLIKLLFAKMSAVYYIKMSLIKLQSFILYSILYILVLISKIR